MSCEAGCKEYGPKVRHIQECVWETVKTGARPLLVGHLYKACSLLKCNAAGEYEPLTDPKDECAGLVICEEDLSEPTVIIPGPLCSIGILLQGCVNPECVNWPESFTEADIELWRRKKNCCITFERPVCGLPVKPDDAPEEKLSAKAASLAAKAATTKKAAAGKSKAA